MILGRGLKQLTLTVSCLTTLAPPLLAQCQATIDPVPVPGSIAQAGATCATAFLVDLGNGTVVDRANYLLWQQVPANVTNPCDFMGFVSYCAQLNLGGPHNWRIPDVAQLQTLLPPGTCQAVMQGCGTGSPDVYYTNGITWSSSTVTPESYYCPGYGCGYYGWGVATGLGTNFGYLLDVPLTPPRKRVDALGYYDSCLVRCVADGLNLAITTPDPVTVPASATMVSGKILTESHLALELTDSNGSPLSGVVLTLRSDRPTLDTIYGPFGNPSPVPATNATGSTDAYVSTYDQTSASNIDSTTRLVFTNPKGTVTWLPANYVTSFYTTCYETALEGDYTDSFVAATKYSWCSATPAGRSYRKNFMQQVSVQGSGISVQNEVVQYRRSGRCYYFSTCPTTAMGTCAQVNITAAVDWGVTGVKTRPGVVPMGGAIDVDTLGPRQAQDTGGNIIGYDIDIYNGAGLSACAGWPNPSLSVTFVNY